MRIFFNWLFNLIFNNIEKANKDQSCEQEKWERENYEYIGPVDSIKKDEDLQELDLEKAKLQAISKCDGCEDEVFVLKLDGKEIDYAANLNQLADRNGLNKVTLYRHWNKKQANKLQRTELYKWKYEITKYK